MSSRKWCHVVSPHSARPVLKSSWILPTVSNVPVVATNRYCLPTEPPVSLLCLFFVLNLQAFGKRFDKCLYLRSVVRLRHCQYAGADRGVGREHIVQREHLVHGLQEQRVGGGRPLLRLRQLLVPQLRDGSPVHALLRRSSGDDPGRAPAKRHLQPSPTGHLLQALRGDEVLLPQLWCPALQGVLRLRPPQRTSRPRVLGRRRPQTGQCLRAVIVFRTKQTKRTQC